MSRFKSFVSQLGALLLFAGVALVGCSDPNYNIGSNFLPDGQQMANGQMSFDVVDALGSRIISTRKYYSNKITAANQPTAMFGIQYDENFGSRVSGFYTQYTPGNSLEENGFGYDPILDSVMLYLSVNAFAGDTTKVIKFDVFEVLNDDFLGGYDSTEDDFLVIDSDDIVDELEKEGVLSDVLFSFNYPDQANGIYLAKTTAIRMKDVTEAGADLIDRLMLVKGDYDKQIYNGEFTEFVKAFKGLYIVPSKDNLLDTSGVSDGAIYGTPFDGAGFGFYGRSKYEPDPTIIQDTVGMTYAFLNKQVIGGGTSVNTTVRDYTTGNFTADNVKTEDNQSVETTALIAIEGMGGLLSELTFEQTIFENIEAAIEAGGEEYGNIFFSEARMSIYNIHATGYGVYTQDPTVDYTLDDMSMGLGLYTNYTNYYDEDGDLEVVPAVDYSIYTDSSYGSVSSFNGLLNRSRGCYTMNIPLQMQDFWNDYQEAKNANGGKPFTQSEWDAMDWNKLYIGPKYTDLFTPRYTLIQGQAGDTTTVPIRLEISYVLLKK